MSKLGLNRAKQAADPALFEMPPPDKKRKTNDDQPPLPVSASSTASAAAAAAWDDDLDDLILTQHMNQIDDVIASTQNTKKKNQPPASTVSRSHSEDTRPSLPSSRPTNSSAGKTSGNAVSVAGGRIVGRGSMHSLSADSPQQMTQRSNPAIGNAVSGTGKRKGSFSSGTSDTASRFGPKTASVSKSNPSSSGLNGTSGARSENATCKPTMMAHTNGLSASLDKTVPIKSLLSASAAGSSTKLSVPDCNSNCLSSSDCKTELSSITEECEYYKSELKKRQQAQYAKDGEIKMLRETLGRVQSELSIQKQEVLKAIERKSEEKNRIVTDLERELERIKVEMKFKEHELTELQGCMKKMERQLHSSSSSSNLTSEIPRSPSVTRLQAQAAESLHHSRGTSPLKTPSSANSLSSRMSVDCGTEAKPPLNASAASAATRTRLLLPLATTKGRLTGPGLFMKLFHRQPSSQVDPLPCVSAVAIVSSRSPERGTLSRQLAVTTTAYTVNHCVSGTTRLASMGLDLLLNGNPSVSKRATQSGHSRTPSRLLASDNASAVLLLPQIEEALRSSLAAAASSCRHASSTASTSTASTVAGAGILSSASADCGAISRWRETMEYYVLRLRTLVRFCRHARLAIVGDRSAAVGDEKSTFGECCSIESESNVSPCVARVMSGCHLLDVLFSLVTPQQDRPIPASVTSNCLEVLARLAESCAPDDLKRFMPLLQSDCLAVCLGENVVNFADENDFTVNYSVVCSALTLLRAFVVSRIVVAGVCSFTKDCPLAAMYSLCSVGCPDTWSTSQITAIHSLMVSVMSTLISSHHDGCELLLTCNCHCGTKVVKDLVLVLRCQLDIHRSTLSAGSLQVLRQGLAVLRCLALAADACGTRTFQAHCKPVGDEFLLLMFEVVRLFRQPATGIPQHELNSISGILPECLSHLDSNNEIIGDTAMTCGDEGTLMDIKPAVGSGTSSATT